MKEFNQVSERDLITLRKIEESSIKLQLQGYYLEALECMERALVLRNHLFGPKSPEVNAACTAVGKLCNFLAMKNLEKNDLGPTIEFLKKAEILTKQDPLNLAVTYNNMACYYRKQGKLRTALQYLQRALKIEENHGYEAKNPADIYLNICAVLSQLGRHQSALEHAQSALILLHENVFKGRNIDTIDPKQSDQGIKLDQISVLAIAYYNIGVEQEFLKKTSFIRSYKKGSEVAQRYLGREHSITAKLIEAYLSAEKDQSKRETRKSLSNDEVNNVERREMRNMKQTMQRLKRNVIKRYKR